MLTTDLLWINHLKHGLKCQFYMDCFDYASCKVQ